MNIRYKIANNIGTFLAVKTNATEDKKERMVYGIWNFITMIMFWVVLYLVKHLTNIIVKIDIPIFTTYISFFILRTVLGGFHLNNTTVCFISTIVIMFLTSLIGYYININLIWLIIAYLCGFMTIYLIGVVDSKNKKYTQKRKIRHKRIGVILLLTLFIINIFFYYSSTILSNAVVIGITIEVVNIIYAKYNN